MAKRKGRIGDNGNMSDALKGFIDANRLQKGLDKVSIEDAWHSVMGNAISKYVLWWQVKSDAAEVAER